MKNIWVPYRKKKKKRDQIAGPLMLLVRLRELVDAVHPFAK